MPTPAEAPSTQARHSRRGFVVGLLLSVVAIAFEAVAVNTAMPAAAADLGDLSLYAWAYTAFQLATTFAIVASGLLTDRVGPKLPLVLGFAVFAAGLVISALAPTMLVLLVGRFVQGLGGGTMNLAVMVLVARLFDARERANLMVGFSAAWTLPSFVGPQIAAWLTETISWHWVFWSVLPVLVIAGSLMLPPLHREHLPPHEDVPEVPHQLVWAAMVALGAASLQFAGQRLDLWSLLPAALGLVMLWFGLRPLLPPGFRITGGGLDAVIVTRTLGAGSFAGVVAFLPLLLVQAEGLSLGAVGWIMASGSIGWFTGSWLQARPWFRLRRDQMIVLGAVSSVLGTVAMTVAGWLPGQAIALIPIGLVLSGLGMGLLVTCTSLVVMQLSPAPEIGRNTSSLQVGEALGNSICAGLAGTVFAFGLARGDDRLGFGGLLVAMLLVTLLTVASAVRIPEVHNHSASPVRR
ncbi:MAG TPA: MFS transporter [Propionicimonas sp.]|nr:MFS transporter [Propionicimonas sp.]HRA05271.1 MFS transporter [Propionicimonas sp.]